MDAVLPKQSKDETGGKLFVAGYQRMLRDYPADAISYLAERSMATCRWFPTIAECLDILGGWRRNDEAVRYRAKAMQILRREENARLEEKRRVDIPPLTLAQIAGMSDDLIKIGLSCGALVQAKDGTILPAD